MANYCTVRDVRAALAPGSTTDGTTTFDTATGAGLEDWQIQDSILEAQGVIDAHLLSRYTIPTVEVAEVGSDGTTTPQVVAQSPVRGWTRDLAAYLVNLTYLRNKDMGERDPALLRYTMVSGYLEAVRDRKMNLPFPSATDTEGVAAADAGVSTFNLYDGHLFDMRDVGLGYRGQAGAQVFVPGSQDRWPDYGA